MPESLSEETACQFYVNPLTAAGMLAVLATPRGEYILQNAAASVLARQLVQIAHHQGAKVIGLVRKREQVQELKSEGCVCVDSMQLVSAAALPPAWVPTPCACRADEVVCTEDDWVQQVLDITGGKGAYAAVDAVAGEGTAKMVHAVRHDGTIIIYGMLSSHLATVRPPCSCPFPSAHACMAHDLQLTLIGCGRYL